MKINSVTQMVLEEFRKSWGHFEFAAQERRGKQNILEFKEPFGQTCQHLLKDPFSSLYSDPKISVVAQFVREK